MFGYSNINYNPIEFIRQILIINNISKKIFIDYLSVALAKLI